MSRILPALLTGLLCFLALMALDCWDIWPHSAWRAAIVGGASSLVATTLWRRFGPRE